jgi:hypothetical protein
MTQRKIQFWVIPPEANAEFVTSMAEVLETYAEPLIRIARWSAGTSNRCSS